MKTTKRFERAVTKLYTAFHNDELDAMDCHYCAVGNMCDNNGDWMFKGRGSIGFRVIPKQFELITSYTSDELSDIEVIFLYGSKYSAKFFNDKSIFSIDDNDLFTKQERKELQYKGLCAVVEYLCELDNIPNLMDYTSLFETEDNKPVNELQFA